MSDTAIVASYNPLSPVFPQSGETLVAQGSSVQVFILQGGRGHWTVNFAGIQIFLTMLSYYLDKELLLLLLNFNVLLPY